MFDCAIVCHLPDGSTSVRSWTVTEQVAEQLAAILGPAHAEQLLTADQSAAASEIGDAALTVHRR